MSKVEALLRSLDEGWKWREGEGRVRLEIIGSTALMLQAGYHRGTKDSDILETAQLAGDVQERLRALGGLGSELHKKHRLYIDVVSNGIPFLPQRPRWVPRQELSAQLRYFEVAVLDVVDVVVSKLAPFRAQDRADIAAMAEKGLVSHQALVARFRDAVDYWLCDARADQLPGYVGNLHQVERDLFDAEETEIELPSWI